LRDYFTETGRKYWSLATLKSIDYNVAMTFILNNNNNNNWSIGLLHHSGR